MRLKYSTNQRAIEPCSRRYTDADYAGMYVMCSGKRGGSAYLERVRMCDSARFGTVKRAYYYAKHTGRKMLYAAQKSTEGMKHSLYVKEPGRGRATITELSGTESSFINTVKEMLPGVPEKRQLEEERPLSEQVGTTSTAVNRTISPFACLAEEAKGKIWKRLVLKSLLEGIVYEAEKEGYRDVQHDQATGNIKPVLAWHIYNAPYGEGWFGYNCGHNEHHAGFKTSSYHIYFTGFYEDRHDLHHDTIAHEFQKAFFSISWPGLHAYPHTVYAAYRHHGEHREEYDEESHSGPHGAHGNPDHGTRRDAHHNDHHIHHKGHHTGHHGIHKYTGHARWYHSHTDTEIHLRPHRSIHTHPYSGHHHDDWHHGHSSPDNAHFEVFFRVFLRIPGWDPYAICLSEHRADALTAGYVGVPKAAAYKPSASKNSSGLAGIELPVHQKTIFYPKVTHVMPPPPQ